MVFTLRTAFVSACLLVRYRDLLFTFLLRPRHGGNNNTFCTLYFTLTKSDQNKHFREQYLTSYVRSSMLALRFVVLAQFHCHWLCPGPRRLNCARCAWWHLNFTLPAYFTLCFKTFCHFFPGCNHISDQLSITSLINCLLYSNYFLLY